MDNLFPHLDGATEFPDISPNSAFAYQNNFDYKQWIENTKIKVCNVNWSSRYDNVVYFESIEKRDEYLDNLEGLEYEFNTAFHVLPDDTIKLPIPAQELKSFNYIIVDIPRPPVEYSDIVRVRFGFFLSDVVQLSPSTSLCRVLLDVWHTFINDISFKYVMLEQGHYPVSKTNADDYLKNPLENNDYLLAPDTTFGELEIVKHTDVITLNNDCYFCIFTDADFSKGESAWLDSDNQPIAPNSKTANTGGTPTTYAFALENEEAFTFLDALDNKLPQAKKTIKACAFINKDLIKTTKVSEFLNHQLYRIEIKRNIQTLTKLNKDMFGYDENISHLAKLYTSPYAAIEITNGNGTSYTIKIENTTGTLELDTMVNSVLPFIGITGSILGVGSPTVVKVDYETAKKYSANIQGSYYNYLMNWNIPTFAISQSPQKKAEADNHYNRIQMENDWHKDYSNAFDMANAQYYQTRYNAYTDYAGKNLTFNRTLNSTIFESDKNFENVYGYDVTYIENLNRANANALNSKASNSIAYANTMKGVNENKIIADADSQSQYNSKTYSANMEYTQANAAVQQIQNGAQGVAGALGGIGTMLSGNIGGGIAQIAGSVAGAVVGGMTTSMSANNTVTKETALYDAGIALLYQNAGHSRDVNSSQTTASNTLTSANAATDITANRETKQANVTKLQGTANNSYWATVTSAIDRYNTHELPYKSDPAYGHNIDFSKFYVGSESWNASWAKNQEILNSDNAYYAAVDGGTITEVDINTSTNPFVPSTSTVKYTNVHGVAKMNRENAQSAKENLIKQQEIEAPVEYGSAANAEVTQTRPEVCIANVITQNKSAIKQAASQFLRYGYTLNQQIDFETFNVMKNFSYWKLQDVWFRAAATVDDLAQEAIKDILISGVTIWRDPKMIGKVSVYDN